MRNRSHSSVRGSGLPVLLTPTIGRAQQIAEVSALLSHPSIRLLTLTGPGGVGKTRLALEIAHSAPLKTYFSDGIFFVSLATLVEQAQIVAAIARCMGIEEVSGTTVLERIGVSLRDRNILLLLDNFEHLLSSAPLVADLLQIVPSLKILATSREVLHLYGEHEFSVPPLSLPTLSTEKTPATPVQETNVSEAEMLFIERVQAIKQNFMLTPEYQQIIARICIHLDGLPLAIELAAARVKLMSPVVLLSYLENRLQILTGGARDLPTRQQSLRNTLDWSYNLLSETEQRFFRRLGVLVGSWSIAAASAVNEIVDESEALAFLTSLVDKSLVRVIDETAHEMRFLLLETIREYALDCLQRHNELEQARYCHAQFYTCMMEEIEPDLYGRTQHEQIQRLDRESANLWAALRWTIDQHVSPLALRLASALVGYWQFRSFLSEGRNWFEDVLALLDDPQTTKAYARILYGAGIAARIRGELAQARERLEASSQLAAELDVRRLHALSLGTLAMLDLHQGQMECARQRVEEGMRLLSITDDAWCRGMLHRMYADVASKQCDFENARVRYRVSLMLFRQIGDRRSEIETLVNFAHMVRLWGRPRIAMYLYNQGVRIFQELDDRRGLLVCFLGLGDLFFCQGKYDEAQRHFEICHELAIALEDVREQASALGGLGQVALAHMQNDQAIQHLKASLRLSKNSDYLPGVASAYNGLGYCALYEQRFSEAASYFEQCFTLARTMNDRVMRMVALCGQGLTAMMRQDLVAACALLKQSLHLAWEMDMKPGLISACEALAFLCRRLNQPERAAHLLGMAAFLRDLLQMPLTTCWRHWYDQECAAMREATGNAAFDEAWNVGRNMELRQTIGLIAYIHVSEVTTQTTEKPSTMTYPAGLTAREVDVLRLLASGLTDARIAQKLVLSPRTVNTHLRSIYSKLGVSTRSAATRFAIERQIV